MYALQRITATGQPTVTLVQDTSQGLSKVVFQTVDGVGDTAVFHGGFGEYLGTYSGGARPALKDALGTVRQVVNDSGSVLDAIQYSAWGEVQSGDAPDPYGFTGEYTDATSGLVYLRARWYNPKTGTLLGRDPFEGRREQPSTLQPHQYAWNAPTMHTDPSGRDPWWADMYDPTAGCIIGGVPTPSAQHDIYCSQKQCHYDNYLGTLQGQTGFCEMFSLTLLGMIIDFIPIIGDIKGLIEVLTNCDLITGDKIGPIRWLGLIGLSELRHARYLSPLDDIGGAGRNIDNTIPNVPGNARNHPPAIDFAQRTGASGYSLYKEALADIISFPGTGAEKIARFTRYAEDISIASNGGWSAVPLKGIDGSGVFVGEKPNALLVIDQAGDVWTGMKEQSMDWDFSDGVKVIIDYSSMTKLTP